MSGHSHHHDQSFPRGALLGAGGLVLFALLAATGARLADLPATAPPQSAVVESRELRFEDGGNGSVLVYAAADGALVEVLASGEGGFVRGVLRGLARERRAQAVGATPPFLLTRWGNGLLSLEDTATGRRIDLNAFGPTNSAAFARFLGAGAADDAS